MKIRIIKLTAELLVELLKGKGSPFPNLPSDVELLDVKMDLFSRQVQAVVRSDSFEDVAESCPIPEFNLISAVQPKATVSKPVAAVKPETRTEPKTAFVKPAPLQSSSSVLKMENEFSPEQRKVLSFTVKGDVVMVKPVQFLKNEWDDINEVVRSLGGKWVKGDIISYWEIPLQ